LHLQVIVFIEQVRVELLLNREEFYVQKGGENVEDLKQSEDCYEVVG